MTLLTLFAEGADAAAASSNVKIAIVGAIAVVLAATIPALLSLRERVPKEIQKLHENDDEYRKRLEREREVACIERDDFEAKWHDLREFMLSVGWNPDTKQKITQEQP